MELSAANKARLPRNHLRGWPDANHLTIPVDEFNWLIKYKNKKIDPTHKSNIHHDHGNLLDRILPRNRLNHSNTGDSESQLLAASVSRENLALLTADIEIPKHLSKDHTKFPMIIREDSPKKQSVHNDNDHEEKKQCKRFGSLPKINAVDISKKHVYRKEELNKHRIREPCIKNVFAGSKSPEKLYEKAEYLAQLPVNPKFDIAQLDSRIEKLCKHSNKALLNQRRLFS